MGAMNAFTQHLLYLSHFLVTPIIKNDNAYLIYNITTIIGDEKHKAQYIPVHRVATVLRQLV